MKYKIINTTDKKYLGTIIEGETTLEVLNKVHDLIAQECDVISKTKTKLVVGCDHEHITLKQIK